MVCTNRQGSTLLLEELAHDLAEDLDRLRHVFLLRVISVYEGPDHREDIQGEHVPMHS